MNDKYCEVNKCTTHEFTRRKLSKAFRIEAIKCLDQGWAHAVDQMSFMRKFLSKLSLEMI